jgi:Zn-dependent M16 (insulinase) family peptidase
MTDHSDSAGTALSCPAATLFTGERLHGFRVLQVAQIPDIRVTAYELEHEATGAKVLHLHCDDRENLYAIGFRTPPADSTGLPHILEHSVLAGSDRFPLKDAFNELVKGTLQTFINAFTYPDKTIYPVASQVRADFFNLARVYTDLVLKPRLLRQTFAQEGHHLELADPGDTGGDLVISGVVYNEMKGAYASPDNLMYKAIQENLYPETPYAHDSGGNPEAIPELTYEAFRRFHRDYYSPSNARWFLYGDIPTADHLAFLEEMLSGFDRVPVDSSVRSQPRWSKPERVRGSYPVGKDEDLKNKTTVNVAWMTAENTDDETALLLQIVSGMLVGSAAGPLRKALIDSGLGQDLSPVSGLERDLKQIAFSVGLRGTDPGKADRIESLILETLGRVVASGFDRDLIEGTLHQVEFQGREIKRNVYPYGIMLMGRAFHAWLYGGDPLAGLNFPRLIEGIRKKWAENRGIFQDIVRIWLLDNPHRLLSVMEPDAACNEKREAALKRKMDRIKAGLSEADLERIRREAALLKEFQSKADSPEALATLPRLQLGDIQRTVETVPTEETSIGGVPALVHDIFTNGVVYLDLAFDISDVPEDLQPYLPLLGKLMTNMGAAGFSYEEMAKRIALRTGGLGYALAAGLTAGERTPWQKMVVRVRALHRNAGEAVRILTDMLTAGDLSQEARMRDLIAEKKNRLHASVIPSGHLFAKRLAGAALSLPAWRDEQWHGKTQIRLLADVADRFQARTEELREKLERLKAMIFRRERLTLNLTTDTVGLSRLTEEAERLIPLLPKGGAPGAASIPGLLRRDAGVAIPAQVCYVAQAMEAPTYADPLAAALYVAAKQLSSGYLYKQIRVQGGAYGGMCQFDPMNGLFAFMSYRDPHLLETIEVYRRTVDYLARETFSGEELEKAVIGAIGALDRPMDPAGRGYTAMIRTFAGLTDADRQRFRDGVLGVKAEAVREMADRYFRPAAASAVIAVYAPEDRLLQANEALSPRLAVESLA